MPSLSRVVAEGVSGGDQTSAHRHDRGSRQARTFPRERFCLPIAAGADAISGTLVEHALKGRASVMRVAVFVIDGHDIDRYPDAEGAAREIEGYDAMSLDYFGADGTVYVATVEGPEWGPVTLHRTHDNRLDDLVRLLRTEAENRGLSLPRETPDEPEAIWGALLAAQQEQQKMRRSRRGWWRRRADEVLPKG